jgi:hypothetical protein
MGNASEIRPEGMSAEDQPQQGMSAEGMSAE